VSFSNGRTHGSRSGQEPDERVKFCLVDRILEVAPGSRIVTVKAVTLSEEYLADHFPTFPVLPGVLMLEVMVESAAWLLRLSRNFAQSMILLKEARNVTYKSFVKPGHLLRVEVTCRRLAPDDSEYSGTGVCDDVETVKGRFTLRHFNLADRDRELSALDERIVATARSRLSLLRRSPAANTAQ
jgi:3-hydroxyacyl-[acyl-carrier-protein] dehydratase